ncbi:MAG: DUF5615 family PIN-like protein [Tepidisphaeraceae bacterium]|jgi:hypothetical protein
MRPRFILDEQLRGLAWKAISRHNHGGGLCLDVTRVADAESPRLGTKDPELLVWAQTAGRIVISDDRSTMCSHFEAHLAKGRHAPGLFLLRRDVGLLAFVRFLEAVAHASDAEEWVDRIQFIP